MSNDSNNTPDATASTGAISRPDAGNENARPRMPAQMEPPQMATLPTDPPVLQRLVPAPMAPAASLPQFENAFAQDAAAAQIALIDAINTLDNLMSADPHLQGALAGVKGACSNAISRLNRRGDTFRLLAEAILQVQTHSTQLRAIIDNQNDHLLIHQRNFDVLYNGLEETEQVLEQTERENQVLRDGLLWADSQIQRQTTLLQQAHENVMSAELGQQTQEAIVDRLVDESIHRDEAIAQRDRSLQDQDQLIETLSAEAQETLEILAAKDNTIRGQERIINELLMAQRPYLTELEGTHQKVAEYDNMVVEQNALVKEKEELLKRVSHQTTTPERMEGATETNRKRQRIDTAAHEEETGLQKPSAIVAELLSKKYDDQSDLVQINQV